jgi:hypothetical protein
MNDASGSFRTLPCSKKKKTISNREWDRMSRELSFILLLVLFEGGMSRELISNLGCHEQHIGWSRKSEGSVRRSDVDWRRPRRGIQLVYFEWYFFWRATCLDGPGSCFIYRRGITFYTEVLKQVLPPFINIRYFRFMKQICLDIRYFRFMKQIYLDKF